MLHSDLSCTTRQEFAAAEIQKAVDKFIADPLSQVSPLMWSLQFVAGRDGAEKIRDSVLAFTDRGLDGYPNSKRGNIVFPTDQRLLDAARAIIADINSRRAA